VQQLNPDEQAALVAVIDQFLEEAPDVEGDIFRDRSLEDPEEFLAAIGTHKEQIATLQRVKEKLAS